MFGIDASVIQLVFSTGNQSDVKAELYLNNSLISSQIVAANANWFHVYIVWGSGLKDSKSFKVFINAKETISYSGPLPDMKNFNFNLGLMGYVYAAPVSGGGCIPISWHGFTFIYCFPTITYYAYASTFARSFKLWDSVVSEDPEYEYNTN
ncbi:MAG: hypothetical protein A2W19_16290 [Spirochaetes bacterium RBG_16_49_21]|nr:MAG: hypothetical protein A2W19_16290 [Spirochaetes bacterium RBG_16_49_21]